jgi:hypothetical protein
MNAKQQVWENFSDQEYEDWFTCVNTADLLLSPQGAQTSTDENTAPFRSVHVDFPDLHSGYFILARWIVGSADSRKID